LFKEGKMPQMDSIAVSIPEADLAEAIAA